MGTKHNKHILKRGINSFIWYLGLMSAWIYSHLRANTLLIIRTDLIGDYVLFTAALKSLRKKYNDKHILLVVQDTVSIIANDCPYINEIIKFNKKRYRLNLLYKIAFLQRIKARKARIVINAVYSRDRISDEIALWSCAEEKYGWDTLMPGLDEDEKARGDQIYTRLITSANINKNTHELLINRELIKSLGIEIDDFRPSLPILEKHLKQALQLLRGIDIDTNVLIGIIPDANDQHKEWPAQNYRELIGLVCNNFFNATVIIFGSNFKNSFLTSVIRKINNVIDLRGKTSLNEMPAVLSKCHLVIGNDTGPIHIANVVGVCTVCIMGGGHFNRFFPYPAELEYQNNVIPVFHKMDCYMCDWNCIYEDKDHNTYPCINTISVDNVYKIVKRELEKICRNKKNKDNVYSKN